MCVCVCVVRLARDICMSKDPHVKANHYVKWACTARLCQAAMPSGRAYARTRAWQDSSPSMSIMHLAVLCGLVGHACVFSGS